MNEELTKRRQTNVKLEKTHTISVKTGSYTTRDGQSKNRYENIGRVMTGFGNRRENVFFEPYI